MADRFDSWGYSFKKNKLGDRMIKQLLNLVIAKYRDLSVSHRSIIEANNYYLPQPSALADIIDLLATDKSWYFAQPRPIIANYFSNTDLLLWATRGACNPNLQVVFMHASHICSQHLFGLPLRMNGMHLMQFDHMHSELISLVTWSYVFCHLSRETYPKHIIGAKVFWP